jgi:general secretion pathway protein I
VSRSPHRNPQYVFALARQRGFTLVEVLVALAVVALALSAGARAIGALWNDSNRQERAVLGQICAENALNTISLRGRFPDVGSQVTTCTQAGRSFSVTTNVQKTPNPNFRRVDANVTDDDGAVLRLTTIFGNL